MILEGRESSSPCSSFTPGNRKRYLFILNPAGRNGRNRFDWKRISKTVRKRLEGVAVVEEALTKGPGDAENIARKAVHDGVDVVVATGGDGTINEVLNGFFEHGDPVPSSKTVCLGILPLGTGSDFVRALNWSLSIEENLDRLANPTHRRIHVGCVECEGLEGMARQQRLFMNVASLGVSSECAYVMPLYKWISNSQIAYKVGAMHGFLRWHPRRVRIKLDNGQTLNADALTMVACGNGQYFGGGVKITPKGDPQTPMLNIVVINGYGLLGFLMGGRALRQGKHLTWPRVDSHIAKEVTIESKQKGDRMFFELDGEIWGKCPAVVKTFRHTVDLIA
ncbi:hypothetical protein BSKO_06698 [Bryopsis sp. KO-2023]|nr:hypothetical protein BSKO_06698 [Bryopsis sp. KO-2023]